MSLAYASLCDGIGAAHVAWAPLGWRCAWTSEIEPFPCAVVEHHWNLPNLGDMTEITDEQIAEHGAVDLVVGGTPCTENSGGNPERLGFGGPNSCLALDFIGLACDRLKADWLLWENVVGLLHGKTADHFRSFIGKLSKRGYGVAWRVLDAGYFGLAASRPRVFVVGRRGHPTAAGAVLLEPEGDGWDRKANPPTPPVRCLTARGGSALDDRTCCTRDARGIRRFTPREWERLMGFPDDYTAVEFRGKPAADSPRYRALGNSMAVPIMAWIGQRIGFVDWLLRERTPVLSETGADPEAAKGKP